MRQGTDGKVYLQAGKTGLWNIEVVGLDTIKAAPGGKLAMVADDVKTAQQFRDRQLQAAAGTKRVTAKKFTPAFTGNLEKDFAGCEFINYKRVDEGRVFSTIAWDATQLYLGWDVADKTPWVNGADAAAYLYAHGDTVDFQLGTDPKAAKDRATALLGDLRLSIGNLRGAATAVIFRKVAADKTQKMMFSSGVIKEYWMDSVTSVPDAKITVSKRGNGYIVEAAIPLAALGITPDNGLKLTGDFGATHGDASGNDTTLRSYWNNQTAGITNDEVFELQMEPKNWGEILFK